MSQKQSKYPRFGDNLHPKSNSWSGGFMDWGPVMGWFGTAFKQLWHKIKK